MRFVLFLANFLMYSGIEQLINLAKMTNGIVSTVAYRYCHNELSIHPINKQIEIISPLIVK